MISYGRLSYHIYSGNSASESSIMSRRGGTAGYALLEGDELCSFLSSSSGYILFLSSLIIVVSLLGCLASFLELYPDSIKIIFSYAIFLGFELPMTST